MDMMTEPHERKATPVYSGVLVYFPHALQAVARVSKAGGEQHLPGQPLHWDRTKSTDEYDALTRHLLDRAAGVEFDTDGQRHLAKVAWRALAALEKEIENSESQKLAAAKLLWSKEDTKEYLSKIEGRYDYDAATQTVRPGRRL